MSVDQLQTLANGVRDNWTSHWFHLSAIESYLDVGSSLSQVQTYTLDTDNHVVDTAIATTDGFINGTGTHALPAECSLCFSLETGHAGRSYRGRSYVPGIDASALGSDGKLDPTVQGLFAVAFAAMLSENNFIFDGGLGILDYQLAVLSVTKDAATQITSIKCGNVMDSQRRRRNGAPESYETVVVSTGP
jgi:hypothetical protein